MCSTVMPHLTSFSDPTLFGTVVDVDLKHLSRAVGVDDSDAITVVVAVVVVHHHGEDNGQKE